MALIKCSECGKEISDKAVSCPHCGAPQDVQKVQIVQDDTTQNKVDTREKASTFKSLLPLLIAVCSIICVVISILFLNYYITLITVIMISFAFVLSILGIIFAATIQKKYIANNGLVISGLVISIIVLVFSAIYSFCCVSCVACPYGEWNGVHKLGEVVTAENGKVELVTTDYQYANTIDSGKAGNENFLLSVDNPNRGKEIVNYSSKNENNVLLTVCFEVTNNLDTDYRINESKLDLRCGSTQYDPIIYGFSSSGKGWGTTDNGLMIRSGEKIYFRVVYDIPKEVEDGTVGKVVFYLNGKKYLLEK